MSDPADKVLEGEKTLVIMPGSPAPAVEDLGLIFNPGNASEEAAALVPRLADEMAAAWRSGRRPPAEDFLARHPELYRHPRTAALLPYVEVCLREERGEEGAVETVRQRFPLWREELDQALRGE